MATPTESRPTERSRRNNVLVTGYSTFSADYHQQYLAKNPDSYCPNHSCGIPYKSAVLYSGEKAR
jgi:peptide methionine sulfoxide reductase MsrA